MFEKCKLFNDILKDYDTEKILKYSQGRVYLFLSIISYFVTLGILYGKALKPNMGIDVNSIQSVIDGEQWAIGLFAGYVFGSKGLEVVKFVMSKTKNPISTTPPPGEGEIKQ